MSKISRRHFLYGTAARRRHPARGLRQRHVPQGARLPVAQREAECRGDRRRRTRRSRRCLAATPRTSSRWPMSTGRVRPQSFERYPKATRHKDFRQMLDKTASASTPSRWRRPITRMPSAALAAMQLGKHVYVEKPLVRTPWEARLLADAARKYKVATQMGNQGYSHEATRVASEIIWSGEIGEVREVHAWRGRASWPQGAAMQTIPPPEPVPPTLDWDVVARAGRDASLHERRRGVQGAENGFYLPFNWRGHTDFGTGGLIGDWGIHILGPANWALRLGAPDQRRVRQAGRHEPVRDPRQDAHPLGVPRARQHAAGHAALVRRLQQRAGRRLHAARHDGRTGAADSGHGSRRSRTLRGARAVARGGRGGAARSGRAVAAVRRGGAQPQAGAADADVPAAAANAAAGQWVQPDLRRLEGLSRHERPRRRRRPDSRDRAGPSTSCPRPRSRARPATTATGFAPARAASRRARTSTSPVRTPSGSRSARSRCACPASSCGTARRWSSPNNAEANKYVKPFQRKGWEMKL